MKTVSLSGSLRENVGKKDAKKNRKQGKIPCVLYGGEKQIHFTIEEKILKKIIFTPNVYLLNITIEDKNYNAILQDIQYHPVTDNIYHADFLEILPGKPIIIKVPVKIEGSAKGILAGGRLINKIRKLKVKALAENLPDFIKIDITDLNIGDSIKVKDLQFENLEFLDAANAIVVGVRTTRSVVAETETPEGEEGEGEEEAPAETAE
ncbi:MAG: 50S ribosomal protein L25/general stress protein Ctc [Bacteroidales bacterium]|nr:50S ribosomal protein L25/general stress protein Ctc [Bacteroidales bacterium]